MFFFSILNLSYHAYRVNLSEHLVCHHEVVCRFCGEFPGQDYWYMYLVVCLSGEPWQTVRFPPSGFQRLQRPDCKLIFTQLENAAIKRFISCFYPSLNLLQTLLAYIPGILWTHLFVFLVGICHLKKKLLADVFVLPSYRMTSGQSAPILYLQTDWSWKPFEKQCPTHYPVIYPSDNSHNCFYYARSI